MPAQGNKALVRQYFEEVRNQHRREAAGALFAADVAVHVDTPTGPETVHGILGIQETLAPYLAAFPDLQFTIADQLAEADRVMTRWQAVGTHQGPLMGHAATGRRVTFGGIDVFRVANGRITEGWTSYDRLVILQQIGAVSRPQ
ncbi:MAG: ester cyclase [Thermomicrobiales bacterium]